MNAVFDLDLDKLFCETDTISRLVICEVKGSTPRNTGASMIVTPNSTFGTIGGGTLEFQAIARARVGMHAAKNRFETIPLGPNLGQCCGGSVSLLTEYLSRDCVERALRQGWYIRRVTGEAERPSTFDCLLERAQLHSYVAAPRLIDGWFAEPMGQPRTPVWIWGAGHVGRALVQTLSGLPNFDLTWIDTGRERFTDEDWRTYECIPSTHLERMVPHAPAAAFHVIVTYSHDYDLKLCDALLRHKFAFAGVIGSKTKWARFRSRLTALGHDLERIEQISCPIGQRSLGKHPNQIALGVAVDLVKHDTEQDQTCETNRENTERAGVFASY